MKTFFSLSKFRRTYSRNSRYHDELYDPAQWRDTIFAVPTAKRPVSTPSRFVLRSAFVTLKEDLPGYCFSSVSRASDQCCPLLHQIHHQGRHPISVSSYTIFPHPGILSVSLRVLALVLKARVQPFREQNPTQLHKCRGKAVSGRH